MTGAMKSPRVPTLNLPMTALAVVLATALLLSACAEEKADCGRLWKRLTQCSMTTDPRAAFDAACRPDSSFTADRITCSAYGMCVNFRRCHERAALAESARVRMLLMNESIANQEYYLAVNDCDDPAFLSVPAMRVKCRYTLDLSYAFYRSRLGAWLDAPASPTDDVHATLRLCPLLLETAVMMGPAQTRETLDLFDRIARKAPLGTLGWCEASGGRLAPALAERCATVPALAHAANVDRALKTQRALEARPDPKPDHFSVCYDLKRTGKLLGEAQLQDAERICTELDLQAYVTAALPAVELALIMKKPELPLECMPPYLNSKFDLNALTSEFAAAQKKKLFDACYSRLGVVVLDRQIPRTKGECEFSVLMMYQAVKTYGLTDPELTGRIRLVEKPCSKSAVLLKEYL